jgi:hypothetical protein
VDLRSAGDDLQHLIGNVQKYFLLPFLYDVRHDIDPFQEQGIFPVKSEIITG